jgi:hypothetical protein
MARRSKQEKQQEPLRLRAAMQSRVATGLREFYKPEQEVPHGLLVLLMQMDRDDWQGEQEGSSEVPTLRGSYAVSPR